MITSPGANAFDIDTIHDTVGMITPYDTFLGEARCVFWSYAKMNTSVVSNVG